MERKDEKILKKVGKLLTLYGVTDEEKQKFLLDLEDKKYDDQEEVEEVVEDKEEIEEPAEVEEPEIPEEPAVEEESDAEEKVELEEKPDGELEEKVEDEEKVEEESPIEEEPSIEPTEEEQPELPVEEQPVEESPVEAQEQDVGSELEARLEELSKTNQELASKVNHLEDIISKLGLEEKEEEPIGVTPTGTPEKVGGNDAFDYFMAKRLGNNL